MQKSHFLIFEIIYNIRKIWWTDFDKSSEMLILDPKMSHLLRFRQNKKFPQKIGFVTFTCLLIPNFKLKNQKILVAQSWENVVTDPRTDEQTWIRMTLPQKQEIITWICGITEIFFLLHELDILHCYKRANKMKKYKTHIFTQD